MASNTNVVQSSLCAHPFKHMHYKTHSPSWHSNGFALYTYTLSRLHSLYLSRVSSVATAIQFLVRGRTLVGRTLATQTPLTAMPRDNSLTQSITWLGPSWHSGWMSPTTEADGSNTWPTKVVAWIVTYRHIQS